VTVLGDVRVRSAVLVAVAVLVTDQVTKAVVAETFVLHESVRLAPFFSLTYLRNAGAAFGLFAAAPPAVRYPFFVILTVVAIGALIAFVRRTPADARGVVAALGGILGGAVGNLVCRLRFGEVIDFLDLHWGDLHWPAFNVADSAISVGVVVVLLDALRRR
jgi:signal peptidase II